MQEKIKEIASRVRELRELSEISVEKMAEYLQVSKEIYEKYENGTEDIRQAFFLKLHTGCRWTWLLS